MPRPRLDGTPSLPANKRKLTDAFLNSIKADDRRVAIWDLHQRGFVVTVQPKPSGRKAFKAVYYVAGRPQWFHIGDTYEIGLADARKIAAKVMLQAAEGKNPVAERKAERNRGTFEELATMYVDRYAKKNNKSWKQADALVRRHLIPKWGKMKAGDVKRSDVKTLIAGIAAPITANQVLASASAVFAWGIREEIVTTNPCTLVDRNPTKSRERVLADSEISTFWAEFGAAGLIESTALKVILLTGQRPGEVIHMRREHIIDGWWELPGEPVPALDWPGTKNAATHRVWLSEPVQELLAELDGDGFVFAGPRGNTVDRLDAAMRDICKVLEVERATPHDLRRTNGTTITALGFGRDAMNRIQNHKEGGIGSVYDRHGYADENKKIMEAVAAKILALVEAKPAANVLRGNFSR